MMMRRVARILCALFLFSRYALSQDWFWQNPLPQGNDLNDVHALDALTAIAAGDHASIVQTTDGGATWFQVLTNADPEADFQSVYFLNGQNGWIAGSGGVVLKTVNGGLSWAVSEVPGMPDIRSVFFVSSLKGWMAGSSGILEVTTDGGGEWRPAESGTEKDLHEVFFVDPYFGWAVGDSSAILHSNDGGQTWSPQTAPLVSDLSSVHFTGRDRGWIAGTGGTLLYTADGGLNWISIPASFGDIRQIHFPDDQNGWVAGQWGLIARTTNAGLEWQAQNSGSFYSINGLSFGSELNGYAVGNGGEVVVTTDGGFNWASRVSGSRTNLSRIFSFHADSALAIGDGQVLHTFNGGDTWTTYDFTHPGFVSDFEFVDMKTGWAIGSIPDTSEERVDDALILKTTNGGRRWIQQYSQNRRDMINARVGAVTFSNAFHGWIVGTSNWSGFGIIFRTTDGGQNWIYSDNRVFSSIRSVCFVNALRGWTVGTSSQGIGILMMSTDGGATWNYQNPGTQADLNQVLFTDRDNGWILGTKLPERVPLLIRTTDGGVHWEPRQLEITVPWRSSLSMTFSDSRNGWITGGSGMIYTTTDGGRQWMAQQGPSSRNFSDVSFADPMTGWIVGENGTILKTVTGGGLERNGWTGADDFTLLANHPNPFESSTSIAFYLPQQSFVRLTVFDILGRRVDVPLEEWRQPGLQSVSWEPTGLASGLYVYSLEADGKVKSGKAVYRK
jgi:photosystem II stability/assembly factor-like uncharacterized protein